MTTRPSRLRQLTLGPLLLALLAGGCGARQPVTYFNLTPIAAERQEAKGGDTTDPLSIGVGPVTLPDSLSRAQIASRLDSQRLRYDDFHRWSSPLADDFAEVLLEDLAAQLPTRTTVALFPWGGYFQPTHRVVVQVSLFDGTLGGEVVLKARWTLTDGSAKETMASRHSVITVKVEGEGYEGLVTAQSQAVADLSREIATALANR